MFNTPPPDPLYSIQQQAQIPPDQQADYAQQRAEEERARLAQYMGSVAVANQVNWTSQGR